MADYHRLVRKKSEAKPYPMSAIIRRTGNTAMRILQDLDGIGFSKLSFALYFFCQDVGFENFCHLYESQLELALANPRRFVENLHKFYNETSIKIRKENRYAEFFEFLRAVGEVRKQHLEKDDIIVLNSYLSMLMQQTEYLRPDKFDLTVRVCGLSTTGEVLTIPDEYPHLDRVIADLEDEVLDGKEPNLGATMKRYGMPPMEEFEDFQFLIDADNFHSNQITTLAPFINEYTYDVLPTKMFLDAIAGAIVNGVKCSYDPGDTLLRRARTLPTNGCFFRDKGETPLREIELKEVLRDDTVYMLYKITFKFGHLSGYYNTRSGFFHSVIENNAVLIQIKSMVLYCYAKAVLREVPETPILIADKPVELEMFGAGGKLKDVYHGAGKPLVGDQYTHEERAIQGYIRKVGEGRTPSPDAQEYARSLGYDLGPDETYVRPFVRQQVVLKPRG